MSIKDFPKKIKSFWTDGLGPLFSRIKANFDIKEDTFIVLAIILIGLAGFGLGKLSAMEKGRGEVTIKKADFTALASTTKIESASIQPAVIPMSAAALVAGESAKGMLVASKNGTKYHFPWCAGASQIVEKNKIWFDSYEVAQQAGYTPASNCKGLK